MTSDSTDKPKLQITESSPVEVPSFPCIVYVSKSEGGGVRARVANLEGIEVVGRDERDALSKVVPQFKAQVAAMRKDDAGIPWMDPPTSPEEGEQKRFLPVHL